MGVRPCANCGMGPVHGSERCEGCYRYWRRTGRDRDPERRLEANRQRLEQEQWAALVRVLVRDARARGTGRPGSWVRKASQASSSASGSLGA
ncbi:MAG TPA: hypothetical protein VNO34_03630 [Actinomycetota bacterium]|nr:hypothetical protein [Actinomycetota bacterium]